MILRFFIVYQKIECLTLALDQYLMVKKKTKYEYILFTQFTASLLNKNIIAVS